MSKMTYVEWRAKEQEKFNALPIYWAYSDEQFRSICDQVGASGPEDFFTCKGLGGGFYLKEDADIVREYLTAPSELPELLKDYEWAKEAFKYEMGNHEYQINTYQGDFDVFSAFFAVDWAGDDSGPEPYFEQLRFTPVQKQAYYDARSEYYKMCDENGWW